MELEKALKKFLDNLPEPFVSEADFQFSLAWELKKYLGKDTEIILEYPNPNKQTGQNQYYDIAIKQNNEISFIELKYKTNTEQITRHGIKLPDLKPQQAQNLGNYAFVQDIERMETTEISRNNTNYCVLLTNDKKYWEKGTQKETGITDEKFKLWKSKIGPGKLEWNPKSKAKKSKESINLKGNYTLEWKTIEKLHKKWKYLLLQVKKHQ